MELNTKLFSLLSDLKEHSLLEKHPDLEEVVKLGYQHLETLHHKPVMPLHDSTKTLASLRECDSFS